MVSWPLEVEGRRKITTLSSSTLEASSGIVSGKLKSFGEDNQSSSCLGVSVEKVVMLCVESAFEYFPVEFKGGMELNGSKLYYIC